MPSEAKLTEAEKLEELENGLKDLMKKIDRKKEERVREAGLILEALPERVVWDEGIAILRRRLQQSAQWLDANQHLKRSSVYKTVKEVRSADKVMYNFMKQHERGQIEYWNGPSTEPKTVRKCLRRL